MVGVLAAAAVVMGILLLRRSSGSGQDVAMEMLQRQLAESSQRQHERLGEMNEQLGNRLNHISESVSRELSESRTLSQKTQDSIAKRLESAGQTLGDLKGQLGQLTEATGTIAQVGSQVRELQDILQSPKLRGGLGEWSLETLLAEVLPVAHYRLQHRFNSGHIVDALVILAGGSVSIDAKFPLGHFRELLAEQDTEAQEKHRKAFLRDVARRVDEIAERYILPDEGTLDFALMFVPAEHVSYEIMMSEGRGDNLDIPAYARSRHVVIVSPNSLYAYLMVVSVGLKGMQIEENARLIRSRLVRLGSELGTFSGEFSTLGTHITRASAKYQEAGATLQRLSGQLQQLESEASLEDDQAGPAEAGSGTNQ